MKTIYDKAVRVIAGVYRSRVLAAPRGLSTRPTTDRLRETLFNVLSGRITGSVFADLYAGSGANGIEAVSRGASHVYLVENDAAALAAIRANLKGLGVAGGFDLEARSVEAFLRRLRQRCLELAGDASPRVSGSGCARVDIVFLDPPYAEEEAYSKTLGLLGGDCAVVLADDAIVIAEHRHKQQLLQGYGVLERYRVLKQGDASLSFYTRAAVGMAKVPAE